MVSGSGSGPLGLCCLQSFHVAACSELGPGALPTAIPPHSETGEGGLLTFTKGPHVPDTGCARPQRPGSCFQLTQDLALETDTNPQLCTNGKSCIFFSNFSSYQGCHICWKAFFLFCLVFLISMLFYLLFQKLSNHILGREFLYPDSTPSNFPFYLFHHLYEQFFFFLEFKANSGHHAISLVNISG